MGVLDQSIQSESNCSCWSTSEKALDNWFSKQQQQDDPFITANLKKRGQEIDELLSEALNILTFEEREEQEEALHGVAKDIAEEASFIDNALKELDAHLVIQKAGTTSIYETAETMSADYVSQRAFRIMFLRCTRYDTKAAADQMLRFFEMKQNLFGNEKLVKDITIEDLHEDDRASLRTGWTQLCGRDRSGRMVIIQLPAACKVKTLQSELRARYFILMNALKSEQTQLRGVVFIAYVIGEHSGRQKNNGSEGIVDVSFRCPIYHAALHFLTDDRREYFLCNLAARVVSVKFRARMRFHFGSHLECQYRLSTYGISRELLPLMPNTQAVQREKHLEWYRSLFPGETNVASTVESTWKSAEVTQPTNKDVLYMGGTRSSNAGNGHLRNLVEEWSQTYDFGTFEAKRRVVNELIDEVHSSGGRFLTRPPDGSKLVWATVPSDEVRSKIMQMFRNRRRRVRGTRRKRSEPVIASW